MAELADQTSLARQQGGVRLDAFDSLGTSAGDHGLGGMGGEAVDGNRVFEPATDCRQAVLQILGDAAHQEQRGRVINPQRAQAPRQDQFRVEQVLQWRFRAMADVGRPGHDVPTELARWA
jgi:hypothetical protein